MDLKRMRAQITARYQEAMRAIDALEVFASKPLLDGFQERPGEVEDSRAKQFVSVLSAAWSGSSDLARKMNLSQEAFRRLAKKLMSRVEFTVMVERRGYGRNTQYRLKAGG